MSELNFTVQVFREGKAYVSYNPELGVASCGRTIDLAKTNLKDALSGFIKSAQKHGTLGEILEDAGYVKKSRRWISPDLLIMDRVALSV